MQPLAAQRYWKNIGTPYVYFSTVDGLWLAGYFSQFSPIGPEERPEPNRAALLFNAGASTRGSRFLSIDAQAPAYWEGWRAGLTLLAARENRLGYFGVGNDARYIADSTTGRSHFYQVSRTHYSARLTVQRRVVGPLRVLAGGMVDHTDFRDLPGGTAFGRDLAAGVIDSTRIPFTDRVVRAGLVLDTRDREVTPHRGVMLEALYASGNGYTRTTASARALVHPFERLVLAGRVAAERTTGAPPLASQYTMESSEQPYIAVGGYRSLRGYYDARFVGPGKLLGGLEGRVTLLALPTLLEVQLVGFYEAGRVFATGESVRLTTAGLHKSGGIELAMHFQRNSLLVVGWGKGSDGSQLLFGTTWSY